MRTLFEGFWQHACRVLLPFPGQAVGPRCLCGGRVENEGRDIEENVSISYGLVGGSDDACVNSFLSYSSETNLSTGQADVILSNSRFSARVFNSYFKSITQTPRVVYPGINISAYEGKVDSSDPDIIAITS